MGQHPDQHRTPGQASADALALLAEHACAGSGPTPTPSRAALGDGDAGSALSGDEPATRGSGTVSRPHLSLLVPAETFVELIHHQRALDTATVRDEPLAPLARGSDLPTNRHDSTSRVAPVITPPWSTVAPWKPVPPATLEDGTPVPMSELARALCDADITRIVMSAEGLPRDVGRAKRLFTTAMRRAAIARDQHCIWNGCTTPASRCEMHHLRWWDKHHGATSLTNAGLLCGHHHRLIHQLDLTVQRLAKPPGWTARQHTTSRDAAHDDHDDHDDHCTAIDPTTPGIGRQPMRYTFRDPTGHVVSAPDGWPGGV